MIKTKYNPMKNLNLCIRTCENYEGLATLLDSIVTFYPGANIVIADQNKQIDRVWYKEKRRELAKAGLSSRIIVHHTAYNAGMGAGYNFLLDNSPFKYLVMLQDNFVITKQTFIEDLVLVMETNKTVGMVGGLIATGDTTEEYKNDERKLTVEDTDVVYHMTKEISEFALVRKDMGNKIRWSNNEKTNPQKEICTRMGNAPYRLLTVPTVIISTQIKKDEETTEQTQTTTEEDKPQTSGASDTSTTKRNVQSNDGGKPKGADSVPGGEVKKK